MNTAVPSETPDLQCPRCHISLNDHPADLCLDVWLAETVLGWQWGEIDGRQALMGPANGNWQRVYWPDCHVSLSMAPRDPSGVPAYSSTWGGMELLVSRATIFLLSKNETTRSYAVTIGFESGPAIIAIDASAPLAAARGMIKSVALAQT